ncbi:MAG: hypothetical protein GY930_16715 [bacterium]|nr:hypothetical protein [bacterium]
MVRSSFNEEQPADHKSLNDRLRSTLRHTPIQFLIALLVAVPLCARPFVQSGALASGSISSTQEEEVAARRAEFMATAERYRTLEWRASARNRLHGNDASGVPVNTPDDSFREDGWVPGEVNVGMPYRWGGFDTPESFLAGIAEGRLAGQIPANNGQGAPPASRRAVGIDCSGFVSRCWDLPIKRSTRTFTPLVYELSSFDDLLPGDLINNHDGHVVLFEEFADNDHSRVIVIESSFPKVKRTIYALDRLRSAHMRPMRYKPLDSRWIRVQRADESFSVSALQEPGVFTRDRGIELPADPMELRLLPGGWQAGSWARYTTNESSSKGESQPTLMITLARSNESSQVIQTMLDIGGRTMETDTALSVETSLVKALFASARPGARMEDLELIEFEYESGSYHTGEREFKARRLLVEHDAVFRTRGREFPYRCTLEAILSSEVPGLGVLDLHWQSRKREVTRWTGAGNSRRRLLAIGANPSR